MKSWPMTRSFSAHAGSAVGSLLPIAEGTCVAGGFWADQHGSRETPLSPGEVLLRLGVDPSGPCSSSLCYVCTRERRHSRTVLLRALLCPTAVTRGGSPDRSMSRWSVVGSLAASGARVRVGRRWIHVGRRPQVRFHRQSRPLPRSHHHTWSQLTVTQLQKPNFLRLLPSDHVTTLHL